MNKIKVYTLMIFFIPMISMFSSGNNDLFTLQELASISNLIVRGEVVKIDCFYGENGQIYSNIKFEAKEILSGDYNENQIIEFTLFGGTLDGITTFTLEAPQFQLNSESILFLHEVKNTNSIKIQYQITGLCQGKFDLVKRDNKQYVMRDKSQESNLKITDTGDDLKFTDDSIISLSDFKKAIDLFSKK